MQTMGVGRGLRSKGLCFSLMEFFYTESQRDSAWETAVSGHFCEMPYMRRLTLRILSDTSKGKKGGGQRRRIVFTQAPQSAGMGSCSGSKEGKTEKNVLLGDCEIMAPLKQIFKVFVYSVWRMCVKEKQQDCVI